MNRVHCPRKERNPAGGPGSENAQARGRERGHHTTNGQPRLLRSVLPEVVQQLVALYRGPAK